MFVMNRNPLRVSRDAIFLGLSLSTLSLACASDPTPSTARPNSSDEGDADADSDGADDTDETDDSTLPGKLDAGRKLDASLPRDAGKADAAHDGSGASSPDARTAQPDTGTAPSLDGGNGGEQPTDELPADCPKAPLPVGEQTFTIKSANGVTYTYILSVSDKVERTKKAPVMIHWHALGSSPEEMRMVTHVDTLEQTTNAIMVYPKSPDQSWDVGSCCTNTKLLATRRDELVFAKELVADLKKKVCVDEKRIYTAGFSNGGMMSQMLACKAADIFAAAFPMGSTLTIPEADCKPSRPIPIMLINGTKDPLVGYDSPGLSGGLSVPADYKLWQTKNGCTGTPEQSFKMGKATCTKLTSCKAGAETAACVVEGMGHCVPGMKEESAQNCLTKSGIALGPGNKDMDGIDVMAEFLLRFSLP